MHVHAHVHAHVMCMCIAQPGHTRHSTRPRLPPTAHRTSWPWAYLLGPRDGACASPRLPPLLPPWCVASAPSCQHDRPPQVQRQLLLLSGGSARLLDHRVDSGAQTLGFRHTCLHVFQALPQLVPQYDLPGEGSVRTSPTLLCLGVGGSGVTSCLRREGCSVASPAFVRVGSAHASSRLSLRWYKFAIASVPASNTCTCAPCAFHALRMFFSLSNCTARVRVRTRRRT